MIWDKIIRFAYADGLHKQLEGMDLKGDGYTMQSSYQFIFLFILLASIIGMLNYYYGLFNRPNYSSKTAWGVNVLTIAIIIFAISYFRSASSLPENKHWEQLHFTGLDCVLFGFTAATYTILFCILISVIIKWKSLNNKKVPF